MAAAKDYDDEKVRKSGLTQREEEALPRWASERMAEFRKKSAELEEAVTELKEVDEPTSVVLGDHQTSSPYYLPDSRANFVQLQVGGEQVGDLDAGDWITVARKDDGDGKGTYVEVHVPNGEMIVRPMSVSGVRIYADLHHEEDGSS